MTDMIFIYHFQLTKQTGRLSSAEELSLGYQTQNKGSNKVDQTKVQRPCGQLWALSSDVLASPCSSNSSRLRPIVKFSNIVSRIS